MSRSPSRFGHQPARGLRLCYHELHGHDDSRARSRFLLQILVLAAMGVLWLIGGAGREPGDAGHPYLKGASLRRGTQRVSRDAQG